MSILNDTYKICNSIRSLAQRSDIQELINSLNYVSQTNDRSHFGYMARGLHAQFFGYLLVDSQREQMNSSGMPAIAELHKEERALLLEVHQLIVNLCNEILGDIPELYKKAVLPYSQFTWMPEAVSTNLYIEEDLKVRLRRSMSIHSSIQSLLQVPSSIRESLPFEELLKGCLVFLNQLQGAGVDSSPKDIESNRFLNKSSAEYFVTKLFFSLVGIRVTLMNICQLVYQSFLHDKLFTLGEDNIFDIKGVSHFSSEGFIVECQPNGVGASDVGSLVLMQDIYKQESKLKLCVVEGETMSFSSELGSSTIFRLRAVDEELNSFGNLLRSLG